MITSLILASSNTHKIGEMQDLLPGLALRSMSDAGVHEEIDETGSTFEENAGIKAEFVWQKTGLDCLSDDSGLCCEALSGAPGIYSARYAGTGNQADNIHLLLSRLEGSENRRAAFVCVLCLIIQGKRYFFEGRTEGQIARDVSGAAGFGYDPVFVPDGFDRSFAAMTAEEKNSVSHRARAAARLRAFLEAGDGSYPETHSR